MTRVEFDLLDLSDLYSLLDAVKDRDEMRAARDAQFFTHICNAPHFSKKGEKPYSPFDFLPESNEARAQREQEKLLKSLETLKALSSNKSNRREGGSNPSKTKS